MKTSKTHIPGIGHMQTVFTENKTLLEAAFNLNVISSVLIADSRGKITYGHRVPKFQNNGTFVRVRNCRERVVGYRGLINGKDKNLDLLYFVIR